jgi:hypothetical protein
MLFQIFKGCGWLPRLKFMPVEAEVKAAFITKQLQ